MDETQRGGDKPVTIKARLKNSKNEVEGEIILSFKNFRFCQIIGGKNQGTFNIAGVGNLDFDLSKCKLKFQIIKNRFTSQDYHIHISHPDGTMSEYYFKFSKSEQTEIEFFQQIVNAPVEYKYYNTTFSKVVSFAQNLKLKCGKEKLTYEEIINLTDNPALLFRNPTTSRKWEVEIINNMAQKLSQWESLPITDYTKAVDTSLMQLQSAELARCSAASAAWVENFLSVEGRQPDGTDIAADPTVASDVTQQKELTNNNLAQNTPQEHLQIFGLVFLSEIDKYTYFISRGSGKTVYDKSVCFMPHNCLRSVNYLNPMRDIKLADLLCLHPDFYVEYGDDGDNLFQSLMYDFESAEVEGTYAVAFSTVCICLISPFVNNEHRGNWNNLLAEFSSKDVKGNPFNKVYRDSEFNIEIRIPETELIALCNQLLLSAILLRIHMDIESNNLQEIVGSYDSYYFKQMESNIDKQMVSLHTLLAAAEAVAAEAVAAEAVSAEAVARSSQEIHDELVSLSNLISNCVAHYTKNQTKENKSTLIQILTKVKYDLGLMYGNNVTYLQGGGRGNGLFIISNTADVCKELEDLEIKKIDHDNKKDAYTAFFEFKFDEDESLLSHLCLDIPPLCQLYTLVHLPHDADTFGITNVDKRIDVLAAVWDNLPLDSMYATALYDVAKYTGVPTSTLKDAVKGKNEKEIKAAIRTILEAHKATVVSQKDFISDWVITQQPFTTGKIPLFHDIIEACVKDNPQEKVLQDIFSMSDPELLKEKTHLEQIFKGWVATTILDLQINYSKRLKQFTFLLNQVDDSLAADKSIHEEIMRRDTFAFIKDEMHDFQRQLILTLQGTLLWNDTECVKTIVTRLSVKELLSLLGLSFYLEDSALEFVQHNGSNQRDFMFVVNLKLAEIDKKLLEIEEGGGAGVDELQKLRERLMDLFDKPFEYIQHETALSFLARDPFRIKSSVEFDIKYLVDGTFRTSGDGLLYDILEGGGEHVFIHMKMKKMGQSPTKSGKSEKTRRFFKKMGAKSVTDKEKAAKIEKSRTLFLSDLETDLTKAKNKPKINLPRIQFILARTGGTLIPCMYNGIVTMDGRRKCFRHELEVIGHTVEKTGGVSRVASVFKKGKEKEKFYISNFSKELDSLTFAFENTNYTYAEKALSAQSDTINIQNQRNPNTFTIPFDALKAAAGSLDDLFINAKVNNSCTVQIYLMGDETLNERIVGNHYIDRTLYWVKVRGISYTEPGSYEVEIMPPDRVGVKGFIPDKLGNGLEVLTPLEMFDVGEIVNINPDAKIDVRGAKQWGIDLFPLDEKSGRPSGRQKLKVTDLHVPRPDYFVLHRDSYKICPHDSNKLLDIKVIKQPTMENQFYVIDIPDGANAMIRLGVLYQTAFGLMTLIEKDDGGTTPTTPVPAPAPGPAPGPAPAPAPAPTSPQYDIDGGTIQSILETLKVIKEKNTGVEKQMDAITILLEEYVIVNYDATGDIVNKSLADLKQLQGKIENILEEISTEPEYDILVKLLGENNLI